MNYSETINDLETKLFNLHPKAKELYGLINGLKAFDPASLQPIMINDTKLVYDKQKPVTAKITFALKYLNRIGKVSEIEKVIKDYEPSFNKQFSTPLNKLREGGVIKSTGSRRETYYGFKNWFNADGSVKEEYKVIEE